MPTLAEVNKAPYISADSRRRIMRQLWTTGPTSHRIWHHHYGALLFLAISSAGGQRLGDFARCKWEDFRITTIPNEAKKGLLIVPATSKTDAMGHDKNQKAMLVIEQDDKYTCPIRAFQIIADKMNKQTFGPFYSGQQKDKKHKFDAYVRVWQKAARQLEIPEQITAHSIRASVATELTQLGFDQTFINQLMRWKPNSIMGQAYDRSIQNLKTKLQIKTEN